MLNPIDIVLIIIVLLAAFISARKGFIWSVLNLGAILLSSILSKLCASPVSHFFYDQFLHTRIMGELDRILPAGSVSGQIGESIESVLNEFPVPITAIAKQYGLFPDFSGGTQVLTVEGIEQDYIVPIVTGVLTIIASVLLFVVFSAILKIVAGTINHTLSDKDKHRFVSRTNTLIGAAFGLLKGILLAAIVCVLLNLIAPVLGNGSLSTLTEGSYFCGLIASLF
jgi:uncharacterized membrane protein required for colicin V production